MQEGQGGCPCSALGQEPSPRATGLQRAILAMRAPLWPNDRSPDATMWSGGATLLPQSWGPVRQREGGRCRQWSRCFVLSTEL